MTDDFDLDDIEACRTCGIYFAKSIRTLRPLFNERIDDPEVLQIRMELATWKLHVKENDGHPQYICYVCIGQFRNLFKLRRTCVEVQEQFNILETQRENNLKTIKSELLDPDEQKFCGFIYIDDSDGDLSDSEIHRCNDSLGNLNIPHMPIKEEHFERVPVAADIKSNINMLPQAHIIQPSTNNYIKPEINDEPQIENEILSSTKKQELSYNDDEDVGTIVKFNYEADEDDDDDDELKSSSCVTCLLCLHVSEDKVSHQQHLQRVHETKDLACHICGKSFKNATPARLKFHIRWHKINKHIKCAQCGFYCASRDILGEHMRAVHSKLKCNICSKTVHAKRMKVHLRQHEFADDSCGTIEFTNTDILTAPVKQPSATESNGFINLNASASDDSQPYKHMSALSLHDSNCETLETIEISDASSSPPPVLEHNQFSCALCDKTFSSIENLLTHSETHKKEILTCHICGKDFDLKFKLNRHLKRHSRATSLNEKC